MSTPSAARRQLSMQMRRLRIEAGKTLGQVAEEMEWSPTKISNIETGRSKYPATSDIGLLLTNYGVTGAATREAVLELARTSRTKSKKKQALDEYRDVLSGAYATYETDAADVRVYEPQYIPGLLQTPRYATAIAQATLIRDASQIEMMVAARLRRQELLIGDNPPDVWAVIDQHALELLVAHDADIAAEQIGHLIDVAEAANTITIQVLPTSAGLHSGMVGPFVILDYVDGDPLVFVEADIDGIYLYQQPQIERYRKLFGRLTAKATDPDDVPAYLRNLL
ncbi:helix-turn-helix domain-containing protein [Nocardiopsis sediminis]|uniref:Helix-turn-helix domain-containing protein n=1 Tax=Nocardiopsis sediminis TaxID=1778267 RepID=A0ABV8FQX3_9ACTN